MKYKKPFVVDSKTETRLKKIVTLLVRNQISGWSIKKYDELAISWEDPETGKPEFCDNVALGHSKYRCTAPQTAISLEILKTMGWPVQDTYFFD